MGGIGALMLMEEGWRKEGRKARRVVCRRRAQSSLEHSVDLETGDLNNVGIENIANIKWFFRVASFHLRRYVRDVTVMFCYAGRCWGLDLSANTEVWIFQGLTSTQGTPRQSRSRDIATYHNRSLSTY